PASSSSTRWGGRFRCWSPEDSLPANSCKSVNGVRRLATTMLIVSCRLALAGIAPGQKRRIAAPRPPQALRTQSGVEWKAIGPLARPLVDRRDAGADSERGAPWDRRAPDPKVQPASTATLKAQAANCTLLPKAIRSPLPGW